MMFFIKSLESPLWIYAGRFPVRFQKRNPKDIKSMYTESICKDELIKTTRFIYVFLFFSFTYKCHGAIAAI